MSDTSSIERVFRRIAEAIPHPAWFAALDGGCSFVNRRWCQYTGRPFDQAIGPGWSAVFHDDERALCEAAWARAIRGSRPYEGSHRLRRADGSYRLRRLTAELLLDDAGQPVRWFGIATEIPDDTESPPRSLDARSGGRTGTAILDSEARYRRLHDGIRDAVVVVDMAGRIQETNAAFREMLGYSDAELRRMTYIDLTPDRWHEAEGRIVAEQILPKGGSEIYEKEYRRKDGSVLPIELRTYLIRDDAGRPQQMWAIVRDISARKQSESANLRYEASLREGEHRYRTLLDATGAITWSCPPDGITVGPQPAWTEFTGQPTEQVLGDGWRDAVHPDDVAEVSARWQHAIATGTPFESVHRIRRRDGAWRWMQVTAAPVRDPSGRIVEWFGASIDIHDRKAGEEEMREAARQKDQFLAILAHELRNPLAPIRNATAFLKTRQLTDPAAARSREVIDRQVAHMARLLDDLLDVSRMSRGMLTLHRSLVSLRDAMSAAVETAQPLIDQHAQVLAVSAIDETVMVDGDPDRLVQIFGNLLTNASKYSPAHGRIDVDARLDGDTVVVAVRDTGEGIAAEHLEAVFELFARINNADDVDAGGLGIGLALVKRLVEMHGGTIAVVSDGVGRGSTFTVRLPARRVVSADTVAAGAAPAAAPLDRRVLIADDNRDAADSLEMILQAVGCTVRTVYGGEAAVREAEFFRPDVVLLDLGMPDMDGREACLRIRGQPWGQGIVMVALTGWGRQDDRDRAKLAGFDHHLVKPADPEGVIRLITELPKREARG